MGMNNLKFVAWACFLGVALTTVSEAQQLQTCTDLNTQACVALWNSNHSVCLDPYISDRYCRNFCGKCPVACYECLHPVRSASDCETKLCNISQSCMLKKYKAGDGYEEFLMKCEDRDMCEGLLAGFNNVSLGKRNADSRNGSTHQIRDTSFSLSCCREDFCNLSYVNSTMHSIPSVNFTSTTQFIISAGPFTQVPLDNKTTTSTTVSSSEVTKLTTAVTQPSAFSALRPIITTLLNPEPTTLSQHAGSAIFTTEIYATATSERRERTTESPTASKFSLSTMAADTQTWTKPGLLISNFTQPMSLPQSTTGFATTFTQLSSVTHVHQGDISLCPSSVRQLVSQDQGILGQYNHNCYELITRHSYPWSYAEKACSSRGGHLVHIENQGEQEYLQHFLHQYLPNRAVWIGLNDINVEGYFQWVSNDAVSYTNWVPGHTSNYMSQNDEDCVVMIPYTEGKWDDIPCGQELPGQLHFYGEIHPMICQYHIDSEASIVG